MIRQDSIEVYGMTEISAEHFVEYLRVLNKMDITQYQLAGWDPYGSGIGQNPITGDIIYERRIRLVVSVS